jgi:hypothetical protein
MAIFSFAPMALGINPGRFGPGRGGFARALDLLLDLAEDAGIVARGFEVGELLVDHVLAEIQALLFGEGDDQALADALAVLGRQFAEDGLLGPRRHRENSLDVPRLLYPRISSTDLNDLMCKN